MTETQAHTSAQTTPGESATRTRTHSWDDPGATVRALAGRPGIELLTAMMAGELPGPPIMSTLAVDPVGFEIGRASFSTVPAEFHYNPLGSVHGGVIATLLDSAAGCAVHSVLVAGEGYTSLDLNTKFVRPVTAATGRITATGTVLARGARTALAEAHLRDEAGKLLAHATSSCLIFPIA